MIYLDNAATTFPKPPQVIRAVTGALTHLGVNPGRGGHRLVDSGRRQVVGPGHGGGDILPGLAQVGADRQGHVHGPLLPEHLHGGQSGSVQETPQFPVQLQAGE